MSSDDKKPAWNRAKVFIGAAGRSLRPHKAAPESMLRNLENPAKSMKIENLWKSLENDEVLR